MKTINLDLPYRVKPEEKQRHAESKHVTEYLFRVLVQVRYPGGINRSDNRIWGHVMDLLDEATLNGGAPKIEVEKSELLWLLDVVNWCLDNGKVPPLMASWVNLLVEHLEEVKKAESEKPKEEEKPV